jgi:hypothetical protein
LTVLSVVNFKKAINFDDEQQYYSDKLALSFAVFCRKKPKSEGFNHLCYPDFADMMRPGHDQSTNYVGLEAGFRLA